MSLCTWCSALRNVRFLHRAFSRSVSHSQSHPNLDFNMKPSEQQSEQTTASDFSADAFREKHFGSDFWKEKLENQNLPPDSSQSPPMPHIPVLCKEVVEVFWRLDNLEDITILDLTFGAGGHSEALLKNFPNCHILALDRDPCARRFMEDLEEEYPDQITPLTGRFSDLPNLLKEIRWNKPLDGILLDAGCSSMQMDATDRGFAINTPNAPLDMRMDGSRCPDQLTAADVVNRMPQDMLERIFKKFGDEPLAAKIARDIVEARFMMKKIATSGDLSTVVSSAVMGDRLDKLGRHQNPATKVFQALRIFVNDELNELDYALSIGHNLLRPKGIFASLTFHSLECKIVKEHFHSADWKDQLREDPRYPQLARSFRTHARWLPKEDLMDTMQYRWIALTKKSIQASKEEFFYNPRARSAKLRAAFKNVVR